MAELSDVLLPVAVLGYLAAMIGYLVEYAFGRRGAVARVAARAGPGARSPSAAPSRPAQPVAPISPARAGADVPAGPVDPPGRAGRVRRGRGRAHRRSAWPCTSASWSPAASPPAGCRGATCTSSCSR